MMRWEKGSEGNENMGNTNCLDLEFQMIAEKGPLMITNEPLLHNASTSDNRDQVIKENENVPLIRRGSKQVQIPKHLGKHLETIMEEEEESFVGETPKIEIKNQLEVNELIENSNHEKYPEDYWNVSYEQDRNGPVNQSSDPKVLTTRQKKD